jgi:EAL domain-containing protein (putative c-di-GMP-specific phosphodiesterase class I)
VNLSARQLTDPNLRRHVEDALRDAGLAPQRLVLEITESVLVEHDEGPLQVLADLRAMGVLISLDDFGTGYSSLSYLRRIPLDSVKIDRAFVSDLGVEPSAAALIEAVVRMAHALGLRVVAEGIETAEQEQALRLLGADLAQGWRLGRPARADAISAWLTAGAAAATLSA